MANKRSQGRSAAEQRNWSEAYADLTAADRRSPLDAADLETLAFTSYMVGRDDEMIEVLERAHHAHLEVGDLPAAARAGVWLGINLALRGDMGPSSGWFGRAERLIERHGKPCVEEGYLLMPTVLGHAMAGNHQAAVEAAARAIEIGERFGEPDLVALAVHEQGRALVRMARVSEGLKLLDEAMVAVTSDDLNPMVTGIIYCSVIEGCHEVQELQRAHSWTEALSEWCGEQTGLVAFTGQCLTHRAELLQSRGAWEEALEEAQRAVTRFGDGVNQTPAARAHYRRGELHRLRGSYDAAEAAFRAANAWGWSPQPGLALLWAARGQTDAARAAVETELKATPEPLGRAGLLPALIEISIQISDLECASSAADELAEIAENYRETMIGAAASMWQGALSIARDLPGDALGRLTRARNEWLDFGAPYEAARARELIARAYTALGDIQSAAVERDLALETFERLGAVPDIERITGADAGRETPLTVRELDVLRLVATGETNKAIADELHLSVRTIDRHLSNIFTKLGVGSRTAAAAYAFERDLI